MPSITGPTCQLGTASTTASAASLAPLDVITAEILPDALSSRAATFTLNMTRPFSARISLMAGPIKASYNVVRARYGIASLREAKNPLSITVARRSADASTEGMFMVARTMGSQKPAIASGPCPLRSNHRLADMRSRPSGSSRMPALAAMAARPRFKR